MGPLPSFVRENEPLAAHTTFAVGGPARFFSEARSEDDVRAQLDWAVQNKVAVFVLGGGSNLLVSERGFDGLVLSVHIDKIDAYTSGDEAMVTVGAGVSLDALVERAVSENWAGLECLSGIPGRVGATPIQNVGAYGQDVSETIVQVDALDRATLAARRFVASECEFAYRDSVFKRGLAERFLLTSVTFRLRKEGPPAIRYAELLRALASHEAPSLRDVRTAVLALRRSKSMVYDPSDENFRSAGSFFTNPIVDAQALSGARKAAVSVLREGEKMPEFDAGVGLTKLAAGWLIERSGFTRGSHDGPAGLSTKHALALVNRGGASATDLVRFATRVKVAVFERFGVRLTPEPVLVGFREDEVASLIH